MTAVKGVNFKVSATAAGLSALSSFTKAVSGIASAGTVAKNSMLGFSSEMNRQVRGYDAASALAKSYASALGQIDRAYKLNAISGDEWVSATGRAASHFAKTQALFADSPSDAQSFLGKFAADLEMLTAKYNPAAAASQRYDVAVVELNQALNIGAIDANQYAQNIQKIPGSLAQTIAQNERLALSMKSAADSMSVFDTEFNRLQAKFNPAATEVRRLVQTQDELKRAMQMGAISVEDYERQMLGLETQIREVGQAQRTLIPVTNNLGSVIDAHNRSVGSWNRGLKDTNRAIQQAGFQVGDFFLQVAGGQNIVLAFTQQAGQLVQFFGMWGSLAAAAIAIGGALWMMFGRGEDKVKKAGEALNEFNAALDGALNNLTITNTSIEELAKTYGQFADEVRRAAQESMGFDLSKSLTALRAGAMDATVSLAGIHRELLLLKGMKTLDPSTNPMAFLNISEQEQKIAGLSASLGLSADQADRLYLAVGKFNTGGTFAEMRDNAQSVVDMLGQMYAGSAKVPPEITKMRDEYVRSLLVLDQIVAVQDGTAAAANRTSDALSTMTAKAESFALGMQMASGNFNGLVPGIAAVDGHMRDFGFTAQKMNNYLIRSREESQALANTNMAAGIAVAAGWAQSLWSRLAGAAEQARAIAANPALAAPGTAANLRWQYGQYGMGRDAATAANNPLFNPPVVSEVTAGGGGGGGASPIEQLREEYAKLTAEISPVIASTKQFRDATAEAMAAFDAGNVEGVKSALTEATEIAKEFKSVADSISSAFMSAFSGIIKGTKSVKDGAMDMLEAVLDRTIEMLMSPVFNGIAQFLTKGLFGFVGAMPAMPSMDGGGYTGNGARSGGLDGKGGFLAMMHPKETVTDHTRSGGGRDRGGVVINVSVSGATGNSEIMEMVQIGVSKGLETYDAKVLPHSMRRVSANPRRFG